MSFNDLTVRRCLFLFLLILLSRGASGQAPRKPNAAEILLALKKFNVVGSALYVAAHPDDENTALIAWLANEKMVNTGYLSLTRGDGGQNLIGSEIRERLGLIRTHELLQARRLDGGNQFFTRAIDFGFSKDYQETLKIWDKEQVLSDMVWTIRKFRPDVMITRFSPEPGGTHGHHTTSAILAAEAFAAAADPKRYPEQLSKVGVWQVKRLLWNTSSFFYGNDRKFDPAGKLAIEVSAFNPLLGRSYTEIAAASRSMHKSQGFGSGSNYGQVTDYLEHTLGDRAQKDLFENVDLSWNRVPGGEVLDKMVQKAIAAYNPADPAATVPALLKIKASLDRMPDNPYKEQKQTEVAELVKACLGLFLETTVAQRTATPGQTVQLTAVATSRSAVPVTLRQVTLLPARQVIPVGKSLVKELVAIKQELTLPQDLAYSQPYWLREEGTLGLFRIDDPNLVGLPDNLPALSVQYEVLVNQVPFSFTVPVVYKRVDPVDGEVYQPFAVTPPVFVNLADKVYVFADEKPRVVEVKVQAGQANVRGTAALQVPAGWRVEPASLPFTLPQKDETTTLAFRVFPSAGQSVGAIKAVATLSGKAYDQSLVTISYSHIPTQLLFPRASAHVARIDLKKKGQLIGYLMGPGDEVPASLSQIGYQVEFLTDRDLNTANLSRYDAVVVGVRAYNTNETLKFAQATLLGYVRNGGTVIVQYNTNNGLVTDNLGPYPFKLSRDRVTVEEAPVRLLKPDHPVLSTPNKITARDFDGWVQERGLYFPGQWDPHYEAILSATDPGESPLDGGLLVARYGKGYYIYTGYAFFRQLPAGVPGAFRLFTNMISIGKK
jgi:LmbE family N-acetylglucosaminyl deacetylase